MDHFAEHPKPVLVPQYDTVRSNHGGFIVLRLPAGKDRRGNPREVSLTVYQAKAILDHLPEVESFVERGG